MRAVIGTHAIETAGARVRIDEQGIIIEAAVSGNTMFGCTEVCGEESSPKPGPRVKWCPLRSRLYGIDEETDQTVVESIRRNIEECGMFTADRRLRDTERTVSFGASEMIAEGLRSGMLDCAVMVCDGAGTVIITEPEVAMAVGAHMTGFLSTSPIPETMNGLEASGSHVLDPEAKIDQKAGFQKAVDLGYKSIAVTIVGRENHLGHQIKVLTKESEVTSYVIACHTSGVCGFASEVLAGFCDVVYSCASLRTRLDVAPKAKIQLGSSIPVFGTTDAGKALMLNMLASIDEPLVVMKKELPFLDDDQPRPLL